MTEIKPEVIDINGVDKAPIITLNSDSDKKKDSISEVTTSSGKDKPSVNFGGGLELLMNDKKKSDGTKKPSADVKLDDLNDLENELNGLTVDIDSKKKESKKSVFSKILTGGGNSADSSDPEQIKLKTDDLNDTVPEIKLTSDTPIFKKSDTTNTSKIGEVTANEAKVDNSNKTWDGFGKFNNIPVDPDKTIPMEQKLSPEELLREKFSVLRKLEALEQKGAKLTKRYNMESSLEEMKGEYEMILADKAKANSCKFQGRMLMAAITGIEFLNNRFDPFDIKLDGWSEQINENIDDYDEIFGELHDKYKSKASMAPELKLLFQLGVLQ